MIREYFNYKVKIKNSKFTTEAGLTLPNSVNISFFDENKKEIEFVELGYIDTEEIYNLIDNNKPINLDNCYIENFSLSAYRKSRLLEKDQYVKLPGFSARNSFFDSKYLTDFSFAEFSAGQNGALHFNNSHFVNGKVSFNSAKFRNEAVNFAYVLFNNGNVDFANASFGDGDVIFKNAIFKQGLKDFQYADFGNGEVSFVNTEFSAGDVSFINTNFHNGNVSFKVARFGNGKIDFQYAKFGTGDITFERAEFGAGKVDFRKVEFNEGKVNFNRSVFGDGDITFEASELKNGRITFKRTVFGKGNLNFELAEYEQADILFDNSDFGQGNVYFTNSKFHILSLTSCHLDNYFDLRVAQCSYIDLSDTIVRDIIDIKPYEFDVKIKILNLAGLRLIGRIDIDWQANSVFEIINRQKKTNIRNKSEQFRTLKENFSKTGQYKDEDKAYVEFKRFELRADLLDTIKKHTYSKIWAYPFYWFKLLIFDKVGLYATNPVRVMLSMIFAYLFFSLLYIVLPYITTTNIVPSSDYPEKLSLVARAFYHSAITFLTIGYGDYYPSGIIRWLSSFEGFIGLFLMSYFTVAFVRKILR